MARRSSCRIVGYDRSLGYLAYRSACELNWRRCESLCNPYYFDTEKLNCKTLRSEPGQNRQINGDGSAECNLSALSVVFLEGESLSRSVAKL